MARLDPFFRAPGVPEAPAVVWLENFENNGGPTPTLLSVYTGASGVGYTADAPWLRACNGALLRYDSPQDAATATQAGCTLKSQAENISAYGALRTLAWALGTHAGTPAGTNRAVSAYTDGQDPGANFVELQSTVVPLTGLAGRYLRFNFDVAAQACAVSGPQYNVFLLNAANTQTQLGSTIAPCLGGGTTITTPGVPVYVGTYSSSAAFQYDGNPLRLRIRNANGSGSGNDAAIDNLRLLDVTPSLDKTFTPTSIQTGGTATLVFTFTNTTELLAKADMAFTDTLPAGLVVANPNGFTTTCTQAAGTGAQTLTAAAGSGTITASGFDLSANQTSCTVSVAVTSTTLGTYTNGPSNVTTTLVPPEDATLVVTLPPVLSLAKTNPAALTPGTASAYSLTVTNTGPTATSGMVTVVDRLPANVVYTSVAGTGVTCAVTGTVAAGQTVTCSLTGAIAANGGTRTFTLTVTPNATANGSTVVNRASVPPSGLGTPVDPTTCTATGTPAGCAVTPAMIVGPQLALTKTGPAALTVGQTADYQLVVTNNGTGPAPASVVVRDQLPPGIGYVSVAGTGVSCVITSGTVAAGQVVTCTLTGAIAAGAGRPFTLTVIPDGSADGTSAVNRARVDPLGVATTPNASQCTATGTPAGCAITAAATVGTGPMSCTDTLYRLTNASVQIVPTSAVSGTGTYVPTDYLVLPALSTGENSLGIAPNGTRAYWTGLWGLGTSIMWYDVATASFGNRLTPQALGALAGAVNPISGHYFFGAVAANSPIYRYDPVADTVIQIGTSPGVGGNGDYAFTATGDLMIVSNQRLTLVEASDLPTVQSTAVLPGRVISTNLPVDSDGIAFTSSGFLYTHSTANGLREVNPLTGAVTAGPRTISVASDDLGSCATPPTLVVRKNVVGRINTGDQFTLTVTPPGGSAATAVTATTTGTATGVQDQEAGPTIGLTGQSYGIAESISGTTLPGGYTTNYSCEDTAHGNEQLATGTTTSFSLTYPASPDATPRAVVCTFTNTPVPTTSGTPVMCSTMWAVVAGATTGSPPGNQIYAVDPATGAMTRLVTGPISSIDAGTNVSSLAVDPRNGRTFAVDNRTGPNVLRLNPTTMNWETTARIVPGVTATNGYQVARAVIDGDGNLFVGTNSGVGTTNGTVIRYRLGLDGTVGPAEVITITGPPAATVVGGDYVVMPDGTFLYVVSNGSTNMSIYRVPGLATVAGGGSVTATLLGSTTIAGLGSVGGASWFGGELLITGFTNQILYRANLTGSGASLAWNGSLTTKGSLTVAGTGAAVGDTASCAGAATFRVAKVTSNGTGTFGFTSYGNVANNSGGAVTPDSITTTAAGTAVTSAATHIVTRLGQPVTVAETVPTGWSLTSVQCVDTNGAITGNTAPFNPVPSGGAITVPPANVVAGAAILCTFGNALTAPVLTTTKSLTAVVVGGQSTPVGPTDSVVVQPGTTLVWTITTTNTGNAPGAVILTETVPVGTVFSGPAGTWTGCAATPTPSAAGQVCTATIAAVPVGGQSSLTFAATVLAAPPASLTQVVNTVTALGPGGTDPCAGNPAACTVSTPVAPAWTVAKTASLGGQALANGAVVRPGNVLTYTVTATAVRGTVGGIVLRDVLADVLDNGSLGPVILTVNGVSTTVTPTGTAPAVTLATTPFALTAPQVATLTYTVTVAPEAWSQRLRNNAAGTTGNVPPTQCTCVTEQVTPAYLLVRKLGQGPTGPVELNGAAFALFADAAGAVGPPITDPSVVATAAVGRFTIAGLPVGSYWLRETKAPAGHNLLAKDIRFTVAVNYTTGVTSVTIAGGTPQVTAATDAQGTATITVADTTPFALPLAGGPGAWRTHLLGAVLLLAAAGLLLLARHRRRSRAVMSPP